MNKLVLFQDDHCNSLLLPHDPIPSIPGGLPKEIPCAIQKHAFELRKESLSAGHQEWKEWDREVIGGNYNGHLGKGLICSISPHLKTEEHFILEGVKLPFSTPATLYRNSPLPNRSLPLLIGSVKGYPSEPVACYGF